MGQQKDKLATIQVLGCLIKSPLLLMDERYKLIEQDFPERFHRILFGAIENLVKSGVQDITYVNIDDYLSKYPRQYKVFTDNKGIEYIINAVDIAEPENFDYYYNNLRKFGLLNQLQEKGFNISAIYNSSEVDIDKITAMQKRFDALTVQDIFNFYDMNLTDLKLLYDSSTESTGLQAGEGMKDLKESLKQIPEMGAPLCSRKLTTIARGRRLKKFYVKTAPSGYGKTRLSVGDAAYISIPYYYDTDSRKWINTGWQEPTLFITTELNPDEIQTMIMSFVSGVDENKILDGSYHDDEEERVDKAIEYINQSPLFIEYLPDFNVDDIENCIKDYKLKQQIGYVFFDYIFTSIKITSEIAGKTRGVKMREDNVLLLFADRMKTLANKLNVHIDTSTQANGDWKTAKDADASIIRGAKAIADKCDFAMCVLPVTKADMEGIAEIMRKAFMKEPNLVYHVYKVRRGKINHVKVWIHFDYSTCRTTDLFVTDNDYKLIDVENTNVHTLLKSTEEETSKDTWF